jgi:hypothetical protein
MAMLPACTLVVGAQERAPADTGRFSSRGLPRDVAREAAALFNSSAALRLKGRLDIEREREVVGDVAVLNGPLTIGGRVTGRVIALNSDVILRPGARIDGDLLVIGGEVEGRDVAEIGGEIRIYRQPLRYREEGDLIVAERDSAPEPSEPWWHRWERRRSDRNWSKLQIASAGPYNRVEGLPINLGPQVYRKYDWGSTRLDAYAIFRTGSSFSSADNDVGHNVRADVRIGRLAGFALGGRLFNLIEPVEGWQISDMEAALASFLAHRDYRDYFQRHGASASMSLFAWRDVSLTGSFGEERWLTRVERDPFTLFRNQAEWRPNPPVDDGRMHVATGTLAIDTRNDEENPWSGWYITADWERGVGRLARMALVPTGGSTDGGGNATATQLARASVDYTRGFLDFRRYNRLSPDGQLNLRLVLGGWLNGDPLPMQRRLSVDGPGVMPGFGFRADRGSSVEDVGTCATGPTFPGRPALCDRIVLAQAEYRGDLHFDFSPDWEVGDAAPTPDDPRSAHRAHAHHFHSDGTWVVFADAGRGWLVGPPSGTLTYERDRLPPLGTFRTDIGAGFDFGGVGFYVAKALSVTKEPARLFVRLRHRF